MTALLQAQRRLHLPPLAAVPQSGYYAWQLNARGCTRDPQDRRAAGVPRNSSKRCWPASFSVQYVQIVDGAEVQ